MIHIAEIQKDFPILGRKIGDAPLVYLDSGATSQKPEAVLQVVDQFSRTSNANVHRGIYTLSEEASKQYEGARSRIASFIGAQSAEIVFTRNATESINLVALSWARQNLQKGDVVLTTEMEHHSNIVPWQMLAKEKGIDLVFVPIHTKEGTLDQEAFKQLLKKKPKLVCVGHMSNLLGTVHPVKEMTSLAHDAGAKVLIDGCQAVPHMPVDVKDLDVEFYAFSGHKMLGPTGIGVLYAKKDILENTEPIFGGGDMIKTVTKEHATWNDVPWKFEAGTPNVSGVIGLGAACDYLSTLGMENVWNHEQEISAYVVPKLKNIQGLTLLGVPEAVNNRGAIFSFWLDGTHPHDIASIFDEEGVAIRAGHMCAQPALEAYGKPAAARASFYVYNTIDEADRLIGAIETVKKVFSL